MLSDDELYAYYASKYLGQGEYKHATDQFNSKRKDLVQRGGGSKEEQIQWAKENLRPILDDSKEFIKRKDWLPLKDLIGTDQQILDNPIWDKTQQIIFENFKPCSSNLIVQRCSNYKPYIDNSNYKFTKSLVRDKYCDLVVASLEIIPIDFTIYYPFRQYDWNDAFETPELTEYAIKRKAKRIIDFIDHFNYKNVLILGPGFKGDTYYKIITKLLQDHYKDKVKISFVMDEDTTNKCIKTMHGYEGLAKVRYPNLKPTQERIKELLDIKEIRKVELF